MSSQHDRVVIVGAGHAGGRMAACLREEGFKGRILLLGDEQWLPHERPPLSKELLTEDFDVTRCQLRDLQGWRELDVELRIRARVEHIDVHGQQVTLADGSFEPYSSLVIATGSRARHLSIPGSDLAGVACLRTLTDAIWLREKLRTARRCCVIGAGLIGLEVAASAQKIGCDVFVLEHAASVLPRVAPPIIGRFLQDQHASHGTHIQLGTRITRIERRAGALSVVCQDEAYDNVDLVVLGVGAQPETDLARKAGLDCSNEGIHVDEYGHTSEAGVFAIGDVAAFWSRRYQRRLRLEAWNHAQLHPAAVARTIVGNPEPYDPIPWAWSDQYDLNLQFLGASAQADRYLVRGSLEQKKFIVFGMTDSVIAAAWLLNSGGERRSVARLIETARSLPDERLVDQAISLRSLAAS